MIKTLMFLASVATLAVADTQVVNRAAVHLNAMGISGNVTFACLPDGKVHVSGVIIGMPPGLYGFHVHEKGHLAGGCGGALGHYNPFGKNHGHPEDEDRHVGDLGNIEFDKNSVAHIDFVDRMLQLSGPHSIIGRSVVLHEKQDDYGKSDHPDSKKTGNAGGRVACGVIGIAETKPAENAASTIMGTSLVALCIMAIVL